MKGKDWSCFKKVARFTQFEWKAKISVSINMVDQVNSGVSRNIRLEVILTA